MFAPHIVCYLELEEETLKEDLDEALERETWLHCSEVRHIPLSQQLERHHAPVTCEKEYHLVVPRFTLEWIPLSLIHEFLIPFH